MSPQQHSPALTEASTFLPLVLAETLMLFERLEVGPSWELCMQECACVCACLSAHQNAHGFPLLCLECTMYTSAGAHVHIYACVHTHVCAQRESKTDTELRAHGTERAL